MINMINVVADFHNKYWDDRIANSLNACRTLTDYDLHKTSRYMVELESGTLDTRVKINKIDNLLQKDLINKNRINFKKNIKIDLLNKIHYGHYQLELSRLMKLIAWKTYDEYIDIMVDKSTMWYSEFEKKYKIKYYTKVNFNS